MKTGTIKKAVVTAGCTTGALTLASVIGANVMFRRVIPRQNQLRVNLDEMADKEQWDEYIKIIHPNKEWMLSQNLEHITIKSRDGLTLHGDYLKAFPENDINKIAICFHGYTSCGISDCSSIGRFLHSLGFDILIVDQRAHGKSEGDYVGFGILDRFDCISWMNYVNDRFDGQKDIVLFGVSMGGATVLMASGTEGFPENVRAIIADCAFTSPYDVFCHVLKKDYKLPRFPIMNINNYLSRKKAGYGFKDYSTLEAVRNTKCPILFIHGKNDNFVPTIMTEENYEACNSPKDILIVENASHAASYYENSKVYEAKVKEFLAEHLK